MPQNTMGSYTGHQVQPVFKTGAPGTRPGQTPMTPQTGLGTGLPPPVPVTQNTPSFNFGGSPIYGGPAISQADIDAAQSPTPRTQLVNAVMNAQSHGITRPIATPWTPKEGYNAGDPNAMMLTGRGRTRRNVWYGGGQVDDAAPATPYRKPGHRGRLSIPLEQFPDQYPDFRFHEGGMRNHY